MTIATIVLAMVAAALGGAVCAAVGHWLLHGKPRHLPVQRVDPLDIATLAAIADVSQRWAAGHGYPGAAPLLATHLLDLAQFEQHRKKE